MVAEIDESYVNVDLLETVSNSEVPTVDISLMSTCDVESTMGPIICLHSSTLPEQLGYGIRVSQRLDDVDLPASASHGSFGSHGCALFNTHRARQLSYHT